jgi:hypothetical protein
MWIFNRDIADQEVPAMENKMQRCRQLGGGGLTRGKGSRGQEAVMQQELEESGNC